MISGIDRLMKSSCEREEREKICRARGGESCAFDGAMIVLQPISDAAHIVHGPIACCGNSWEGRGTLSSKGNLHIMGFTTDMNEMDIIYGSEEKLYHAILKTYDTVKPKAIFVYSTCVSGLIGEDIEAICRKAETDIGARVIPVNAPGFVGPKNLGNRIAGEVLLDHVIGTGKLPEGDSPDSTASLYFASKSGTLPLINLIGEYNIAGDLWLVEHLLTKAGIRILSRITGDSTFDEITFAHRAKLNVVVCSRALINIAREMEKKYGIPYAEVSFFGKTEMSKALRLIGSRLGISERIEKIIEDEGKNLDERLKQYESLKGKKAVLYTGGVKSWSFISALIDLGIEIVAVGTKKSTFEDEEKMKEILGENAPLIEDVTPKNLSRLMRERNADMLIAGGRNQYLAVKEGFPFVDVNQERHNAYAGYDGLVNLAEQISNSIRFYSKEEKVKIKPEIRNPKSELVIDPLKHSQSIGAAIAFQGIDNAVPIIHGAQGCTFLGKVLLTKHFREPIALASTRLFTENVVMGSEVLIENVIKGFIEKNPPDLIAILTSGLSEVKGDDVTASIRQMGLLSKSTKIAYVPTPDYEGGLETGYMNALKAIIDTMVCSDAYQKENQINVLAGSHLTPADFAELRELFEVFGLKPIMLPDLSALDGSRQGMSAIAIGGTNMEEISSMGSSRFTIAIGSSMEDPAKRLKDRFSIEYKVLEGISGLRDSSILMETLSMLSGRPILSRYERQRKILVDAMRDLHFYYGSKKVCLALEPDLSIQISRLVSETGANVELSVVPNYMPAIELIQSKEVLIGDLSSLSGDFDLLISNSHAEKKAERLGIPLYQLGFPTYKVFGNNHRVTIGYRGTLTMINEIANLLMSH